MKLFWLNLKRSEIKLPKSWRCSHEACLILILHSGGLTNTFLNKHDGCLWCIKLFDKNWMLHHQHACFSADWLCFFPVVSRHVGPLILTYLSSVSLINPQAVKRWMYLVWRQRSIILMVSVYIVASSCDWGWHQHDDGVLRSLDFLFVRVLFSKRSLFATTGQLWLRMWTTNQSMSSSISSSFCLHVKVCLGIHGGASVSG